MSSWHSSNSRTKIVTTLIIGMGLYEALYGMECRTSLYWQDIDESLTIESDLIQATNNKIRVIQVRMKMA